MRLPSEIVGKVKEMQHEKVQVGILGGGGILGAHGPAFMANTDHCSVAMVAEPAEERHAGIYELFGNSSRTRV